MEDTLFGKKWKVHCFHFTLATEQRADCLYKGINDQWQKLKYQTHILLYLQFLTHRLQDSNQVLCLYIFSNSLLKFVSKKTAYTFEIFEIHPLTSPHKVFVNING